MSGQRAFWVTGQLGQGKAGRPLPEGVLGGDESQHSGQGDWKRSVGKWRGECGSSGRGTVTGETRRAWHPRVR